MIGWFDLPNLTTLITKDNMKDYGIEDDAHTFGHVVNLILNGRISFD